MTRLFQSNIAIYQRGFLWQAITSSACCRCLSLGPQLPNSPWKQYLYIYYIFTQYLPCCKTISYLTINLLMFFFFGRGGGGSFFYFYQPCLFPALLATSVSIHLCLFQNIFCFFSCFCRLNFFPFLYSEGIFLSLFSLCVSMKLDFSALLWRTITAAIAIS